MRCDNGRLLGQTVFEERQVGQQVSKPKIKRTVASLVSGFAIVFFIEMTDNTPHKD